jgi:amidophosphoribosyltransferase
MCGILGIRTARDDMDVAPLLYQASDWIYHRGHTSSGIATHGADFKHRIGEKYLRRFLTEKELRDFRGNVGITHTRYSTSGSDDPENIRRNAQPYVLYQPTLLAVAFNGSAIKPFEARDPDCGCDVKILSYQIADGINKHGMGNDGMFRIIEELYSNTVGGYTIGGFYLDGDKGKKLFVGREPRGTKPGSVGFLPDGKGFAFCSEQSGLRNLGCKEIREILRGEFIIFDKNGCQSVIYHDLNKKIENAPCGFEFVYFSGIGNKFCGKLIKDVRKGLGHRIAIEHPVEADIVTGVPDSGTAYAQGYAEESGIRYEEGFERNRYMTQREFIMQTPELRELVTARKVQPIPDVVKGKDLVVTEDSIVRATTSRKRVADLKEAGAKTVHMRIGSPPLYSPCITGGIDMTSAQEFIFVRIGQELGIPYDRMLEPDNCKRIKEGIRRHIGADSLEYLSLEGLAGEIGLSEGRCLGCWNPKYYPEDLKEEISDFIAKNPAGRTK